MNFYPVILWTDILIYLLVVAVVVFIFWARNNKQMRSAWHRILRSRVAKISLVVLIGFVTIGLLDSIHFQISSSEKRGAVVSLFDCIVSPLGDLDEKTYSAPFAKHLYVKEIITLSNGSQIRDYPPLKHFHLLGTGKVGEDIFFQTLKSIRTGLVIGTLTTLVMLPFAIIFGMTAGYFRGFIDDCVQYIYTTLSSIPDVLLIAAVVLALQIFISNHANLFPTILQRADMRLLALCVILGITSWTSLCRVLRGETLKLREMDYIQAAIALGTPTYKILTCHILPNLVHLILIAVVMDFSGLVLAEAVLTYVGVGVDATTISWGNMIDSARLELARDPIVWWPLVAAFVFMFTLVISANLFADKVRAELDPRAAL